MVEHTETGQNTSLGYCLLFTVLCLNVNSSAGNYNNIRNDAQKRRETEHNYFLKNRAKELKVSHKIVNLTRNFIK